MKRFPELPLGPPKVQTTFDVPYDRFQERARELVREGRRLLSLTVIEHGWRIVTTVPNSEPKQKR